VTNNKKVPKKLLKSFFGAIGDPVGKCTLDCKTKEALQTLSIRLQSLWLTRRP